MPPFFAPNSFIFSDIFFFGDTECFSVFLRECEGCHVFFVKLGEVCRDEMRKVVGQPSDDFASIPHPDEVSHVLELETAVSGTATYFVVLMALEVKPFPRPVDLNVAFRIKRADKGCRALEVAPMDGGAKFVFVSELDFVHRIVVSKARLENLASGDGGCFKWYLVSLVLNFLNDVGDLIAPNASNYIDNGFGMPAVLSEQSGVSAGVL